MNIPKLLDDELDEQIDQLIVRQRRLLQDYVATTKEITRLTTLREVHAAMREARPETGDAATG